MSSWALNIWPTTKSLRRYVSGFKLAVGRRNNPRFSVIGAGNGGMAMAGHLGASGFSVSLYNRSFAKLREIVKEKGVYLEGAIRGFGPVDVVTDDLEEAVRDSNVIMVVVPASAHRELAKSLAPYLKDGQIIVLNPGRTFGAIEFDYVLRTEGCLASYVVAEAQTLIYASRAVGPARVRIMRVKNRVEVAALPAWETHRVITALRTAFHQFVAAANVLQTSVENIGCILHPAPVLFNLARIEGGCDFAHYTDGITPAVAALLEGMDEERLAIAKALGITAASAREWMARAYGSRGASLYEAIQGNEAYVDLKAPSGLDTRYLTEDVPTGLVPLSSLGEFLEVPTPLMNSVINLASRVTGIDFRRSGRTLERLGLVGVDLDDLYCFVLTGRGVACRVVS